MLADSTDLEEIAYETTLDAVTYGLLDLSTNSQFKTILNTKVQEQFDGDDNVLLLDLNDALNTAGINLLQEMTNSLNNHNKPELIPYLNDAINGLSYNNGTIFAHVFIPFIEGKDLTAIPVICTNYDDDAVLPGFKLGTGAIETSNVTEQDATSDLVWVVAFNESVNNVGVCEAGTAPPLGFGNIYQRNLIIWEMNISDKKEGWGNGRADISFVGCQIKPGCSAFNISGEPFAKVSNKHLNTWYQSTYQGGWLGQLANIGLGHFGEEDQQEDIPVIIYEKDVRKKFIRNVTLVPGCGSSYFEYRSKETPYGIINPVYSDYPAGSGYHYVDYSLNGATIKYRGHTD